MVKEKQKEENSMEKEKLQNLETPKLQNPKTPKDETSSAKPFSWGAEAELYGTDFLGERAVVKKRVEKKYRVKELDEKLRRTRTRTEARILGEAKKTGARVPTVLGVEEFDITMEFIKGKLLRDELENKNISRTLKTVGEYLALLHDANIVHGDFTPANVIVDGNKATIIDFGLGGFSRETEEKAVDLLLMKKALADKKKYAKFIQAYEKKAKNAEATLKQLEEIEQRGRYVVRAMMK
ncbi:Kae1-associated serine/threonine protein kinase [Candidatus Micrarchaeota archaeon]|nr:Kae1-associated serine/threonine protein kinase [Candidatus Micrarchaeota archaeon]